MFRQIDNDQKEDSIQKEIKSINEGIFNQKQQLIEVKDSQKKIMDEQNNFCDKKTCELKDVYSKVQQLETIFNEQEKSIKELMKNKETQLRLLDNQSLKKYNLTQQIRKIEIKLAEFEKFSDLVNKSLKYFCEISLNTSNTNQLPFNFYSQDIIEQDIFDIQDQINLLGIKQQKDIDYIYNIIKQFEQNDKILSKQFIFTIIYKFIQAQTIIKDLIQSNNHQLQDNQAVIQKLQYWPQQNGKQIIQQYTTNSYLIIQKFDEQLREINTSKLISKRQIRNIKFIKLISYNLKMRQSNVETQVNTYLESLRNQVNNIRMQQLGDYNYDKYIASGEEQLKQSIEHIQKMCQNQEQEERLKAIENEFSEFKLNLACQNERFDQLQISNSEKFNSCFKADQFISITEQYNYLEYKEIQELQNKEKITLNNLILNEKQKSLNQDLQIEQEFSKLQSSYQIFFHQELNILQKKILILSKEQNLIDCQQIQTQEFVISNMNTILIKQITFSDQQERNIQEIINGINILQQYFDTLPNSYDEFFMDQNQEISFSSLQQLYVTYDKLLNNKSKQNSEIYLKQLEQFQNSKEILKIAIQQYTQKKLELDNQINLCKRVMISKTNELKQSKDDIAKTKSLITRLKTIIDFRQGEYKLTINQFNICLDELEVIISQLFLQKSEFYKQYNKFEEDSLQLQILMENQQNQRNLLNLQLQAYKLMKEVSDGKKLLMLSENNSHFQELVNEQLMKEEMNLIEPHEQDIIQQIQGVESNKTVLRKGILDRLGRKK